MKLDGMGVPRKKPVTLAQLAAKLNLSSAAVSRALNDGPSTIRVSQKTVERVRRAAEQMGYRPNRMARALRTGRTGMIGIITDGGLNHLGLQHLYYARLESERRGLLPIIQEISKQNEQAYELAVDLLIDAKVDGVVVIKQMSSYLDRFHATGIPVVGVSVPDLKGVPRYCPDGIGGVQALTSHLIEVGCRSLVLIAAGSEMSKARKSRWDIENGFDIAIEEARATGLEVKGEIFVERVEYDGMYVKDKPDMHGLHTPGYLAMQRLLVKKPMPDAIIGITDHLAEGALTACAENSIKVPEQIMVAGFGNAPGSSAGYLPLTSVSHPLEEMHHQAFDELSRLIESRSLGVDKIELLPCCLEIRRSTMRRH